MRHAMHGLDMLHGASRVLLEYLKMYFELYHIFTQISGHERQIDVGEFRDAAERSVRCLRVFALRNEALGPSEQILMLCRKFI